MSQEVISERVKAVSGWKLLKFKQSLLNFGKPEIFRAKVKTVLLAKQKKQNNDAIAEAVAKAQPKAEPRGLFGGLFV